MGAAVLVGVTSAGADEDMANMHHHEGMTGPKALIDTSAHCVVTGQACLNHCLMLLGDGDTSMADCARSVNEMLAICGALQALAAQNAPALPKLAAVAADTCKQCEDACRKHEKKHQVCKDCADACADCLKECKKIAA